MSHSELTLQFNFCWQDSKMTEKTVEFTCMPAGRQADLYLKKVNQGKLIPEFKNLETSFSSQVQSLLFSIIHFRLLISLCQAYSFLM